jgi:hypothetical protein
MFFINVTLWVLLLAPRRPGGVNHRGTEDTEGEHSSINLTYHLNSKRTVTVTVEPLIDEKTKTKETLSQARERFAKVREHFQGRNFLDSTELLREDRQR